MHRTVRVKIWEKLFKNGQNEICGRQPLKIGSDRVNSRPKLCPTSGRCPGLVVFKKFFYQKQCKYAIKIGVAQVRGALLRFSLGKSTLLYLCRILPSISKITPE